jgi:uncharacterized protein DUF1257
MSQSVEMETVVRGMSALLKAIAESGLRHEERGELVTEDGRRHEVDLVVTDEAGTEVGVKVDKKTGVATFVGHDDRNKRASALANRIAQRYAYSKALDELKRKGYQVAREEKQKDGTIKIVAQRWR